MSPVLVAAFLFGIACGCLMSALVAVAATKRPAHPKTANPSSQHDPTTEGYCRRLLNIAPELLRELKTVINWIQSETEDDPRPPSEVVRHAKEVIARAEGRS